MGCEMTEISLEYSIKSHWTFETGQCTTAFSPSHELYRVRLEKEPQFESLEFLGYQDNDIGKYISQ